MRAPVLAFSLALAACNTPEAAPAAEPTSAMSSTPATPPACLGLGPDEDACALQTSSSTGDALNVHGRALASCSTDPMTGWTRDGTCNTGPEDRGVHVVCAEMTEAFLSFTKDRGNDLSTPHPEYRFPGLVPGDRWCLCAARWKEAHEAGVAPPAVLDATHAAALRIVEPHRFGLER